MYNCEKEEFNIEPNSNYILGCDILHMDAVSEKFPKNGRIEHIHLRSIDELHILYCVCNYIADFSKIDCKARLQGKQEKNTHIYGNLYRSATWI